MRFALAIALLWSAQPSWGWEFRAEPICILRHSDKMAEVEVTFDPAAGEYAIHVSLTSGNWPTAELFGIRFEGPSPNLIVTDRHKLSDNGRTLTVTDRGFGNVLDGLAFNRRAVALAGDISVPFELLGAAPKVDEFRGCPQQPSV